jgi:hypothetical protein
VSIQLTYSSRISTLQLFTEQVKKLPFYYLPYYPNTLLVRDGCVNFKALLNNFYPSHLSSSNYSFSKLYTDGFLYIDKFMSQEQIYNLYPLIKLHEFFSQRELSVQLTSVSYFPKFYHLFVSISELLSNIFISHPFLSDCTFIPWRSSILITDSLAVNQNFNFQQNWHYDTVPDYCITCFIYLNTTFDGSTAILTAKDSFDLSTKTDYISLPYYRSTNNLDIFGYESKPFFANPIAGNLFIFHPSLSMHKALHLSHSKRVVLAINLAVFPDLDHTLDFLKISANSLLSSFVLGLQKVQAAPVFY